MPTLTIGEHGELTIPPELRERFGFAPDRPIRVIETSTGVFARAPGGTSR